jgi:hypothetical protein
MVARVTEFGGLAPQKISLDHEVSRPSTNSFATERATSHVERPTVQQPRLKASQLQSNSTPRRLDEFRARSGPPLDFTSSDRQLAHAESSPSKRKVS